MNQLGVIPWQSLFFFSQKKRKENCNVTEFFFFGGGWKGIPVQCATQQPDSSCLCRRDILEKVLEQFLHWYFFTSEWVCRWALRLDLSANALLQCGQENGFSPVSGARNERGDVRDIATDSIWIGMFVGLFWQGPVISGCMRTIYRAIYIIWLL